MKVRVRDRASEAPWGSGPTNPIVRTVWISDSCPVCGGPRGVPRNLNQHDDGVHYSVDVWDNPCGHVDAYTAVLAEAKSDGHLRCVSLDHGPKGGLFHPGDLLPDDGVNGTGYGPDGAR